MQIVLENPLLQDALEDVDEDDTVAEMEITGALKAGKISETGANTITHVNNVAKLRERLESIQKKLPWIESLDVTVDLKIPAEEMKTIVNDNFKQEMVFYKQSQIGAQQSIARLRSMGVETLRPEDYFAEMVKSDDHMRKVKEKLVSKQLVMERTEKVTKMRKMKKLGKKVQQEVLKKRSDDKKSMMDSVKRVRKGHQQDEDFEINTTESEPSGSKKGDGINRKRKAKDSKYGSGGKKKNARKNTEESYKDVSSFSSRIHSKPKRSAKNDKKMPGGKPSRPGKSKRAGMKNKQASRK